MKMKKKPRKPSKSSPLDSVNWVSESSVQAFGAPLAPDQSGSGSGADKCEGKQFIASIGLEYPPVVIIPISGAISETIVDPLPPEPEAEVLCDGDSNVWKARLSKLEISFTQKIAETTKLLTSDLIAATDDCLLLEDMWDDLEYFRTHIEGSGVHGPYWLPEGFIQSHEDVHLLLIQQSIAFLHSTLVSELESITRPCEDFSQAEAGADMKAEIDAAVQRFKDGFEEVFLQQMAHEPRASFLSVQEAFLAPWLDMVDVAGVTMGCWP
jgi:hypothetical protein